MTLGSCKVKKEDKVEACPQKMAVSRAVKHKMECQTQNLLLCTKHKQGREMSLDPTSKESTNKTKALLSIYFLSNRLQVTCIYMETIATVSKSADKSNVFKCWKIRGEHIILML